MTLLRSLVLGLTFLFPFVAHAGSKKKSNILISFHMETDGNENPKMIFTHKVGNSEKYFRRMPEIATKDIQAFAPFPADDGTYGLMIQLTGTAKNRLESITIANQGRMLASAINGRIIDYVTIDSPISDGNLVIWHGVSSEAIKEIDKATPRIGEKKK